MNDVIVTVRGSHEVETDPDWAALHLRVVVEGPEREPVVMSARAAAQSLRERFEGLERSGAVSKWSSRSLSVGAQRPWVDGKQRALVHTATVPFIARFADFGALGEQVSAIAGVALVRIDHVEWGLDPQTHARVEQEVATAAIGVATARATAYAIAIGRTEVVPEQIADLGMLEPPERQSAKFGGRRLAAMSMDAAGGGAEEVFGFVPEPITVSASIDARFLVR